MAERLVARELSAWHGQGGARVPVFERISFEVRPGEVLGLVGPNGCGKTTLLRALAGLHGEVAGELRRPARIAVVPQGCRASFFGWASLRANLALTGPLPLGRRREHRARLEALLERLGLALDLGLRPGRCSDGMLQQAALVRALLHEPDLLLGDEPFSALDLDAARKLKRALRDAAARTGMAAVVVLHDLDSVVELCDRVLAIPGRPFAMAGAGERAVLLDNGWRRRGEAGAPDEPLVAVMRRALSAEAP